MTCPAVYSGVALSFSGATKLYLKLKTKIIEFKRKTIKMFENYHASGIGTQKWHTLRQITDSIRGINGVEYSHAGIFESAHRISKRQYRKNSQERKSVRGGTLSRTTTATNLHRLEEHNLRRKARDLQEANSFRAAHTEVPFFTKARTSSALFKDGIVSFFAALVLNLR